MKVSHGIKDLNVPEEELNKKDHDSYDYPTGKYDWPKPYAMSWSGWKKWKKDMKEKYPVRYFIRETLEDWWSRYWTWGIVRRFKDIYWWFMHRLHPKHRYHVIDTGLKPNYYDPDTLIFEGVFKLLCDFVEYQKKYDVIDWEADEPHSKAWKEMCELYDWYKEIRPHREEEFEKRRPEPMRDFGDFFNDEEDIDPEKKRKRDEYSKYLREYTDAEASWYKEDEDQLIRIIKLREYLWYA